MPRPDELHMPNPTDVLDNATGLTARIAETLRSFACALSSSKAKAHRKMPRKLTQEVEKFIDPGFVPQWLNTPNPMLGGKTPQAVLDSHEDRLIHEVLERLKSGTCG